MPIHYVIGPRADCAEVANRDKKLAARRSLRFPPLQNGEKILRLWGDTALRLSPDEGVGWEQGTKPFVEEFGGSAKAKEDCDSCNSLTPGSGCYWFMTDEFRSALQPSLDGKEIHCLRQWIPGRVSTEASHMTD